MKMSGKWNEEQVAIIVSQLIVTGVNWECHYNVDTGLYTFTFDGGY